MNIILHAISFSSRRKGYSIFFIYLIWIFACEIIFYVMNQKKMNNLFFSHYYLIIQFILLGTFYYQILTEKYQKKIALILLITVPSVLIMQYIYDPQKYFVFNLFEIFITSYSIIVLALFHLYNLLDTEKKYYYITLGMLLYLISSSTIFLSGNLYTVMNMQMHKEIWVFNAMMFILYQVFIFIETFSFRKNRI